MNDTVKTRAVSLAASTAALGLAVFAALTFTIALRVEPLEPGGVIVTSVDPPPPTDTTPHDRATIEDFAPLVAPPLGPVIASGVLSQTPWPVAADAPVIVERPNWVVRPHDLARYYPTRARTRGVEGVAVLDCRVDVFGALACNVTSETPSGWGFGDAALRIAADHRMAPATRDGLPVEGRYRMQVPFNLN